MHGETVKFIVLYILLAVHPLMIHGKWPNWRTIFFYVFISILYMFRATSCSSSGETIVSIQSLVYVTLCRWPFLVTYTCRLYWYNWLSWLWARGCSKHVENWNKYLKKNASSWSFTVNHNMNNLFKKCNSLLRLCCL